MSINSTDDQSGKRTIILVTAATVPVGRSIVEQLVAMGHPVRALTRDPKKAGLPAGAGDLSDAESLAAAFQDISAVFLLAAVPGFTPPFLSWVGRGMIAGVEYGGKGLGQNHWGRL